MESSTGIALSASFVSLLDKTIDLIRKTSTKSKSLSEEIYLEVQQNLLSLKSEELKIREHISTLLKEIERLSAEISRLNDWNTEKPNYIPHTHKGRHVRFDQRLKNEGQNARYYCDQCYEDGKARVLQPIPDPSGMHGGVRYVGPPPLAVFKCTECDSVF